MSVARRYLYVPLALLISISSLALTPDALAKTPKSPASCEPSAGSVKSLLEAGETVPVELSSPLEASVLSRFALLRRAALPSDQIPSLSPVGGEVDGQLLSYYPASVRQLKSLPNGNRYFLIPGFAKPQSVPPAGCLPASQRRQRPELVEKEHKLAAEPVYCIAQIGRESAGAGCTPFAEIEESPRVFAPSLSEEPIVELVPDGVSSVRVTYIAGPPVVATVEENAYVLVAPAAVQARSERRLKKVLHRLEHAKHHTKAQQRRVLAKFLAAVGQTLVEAEPRKVEWLNSSGGLILSIARPKAGAEEVDSLTSIVG
jgi:hypothetical protein